MEVSAGTKRRERKSKFKVKLEEYLRDYKNIMVVGIDNVGSNQMQKIRILLRGKAVMLMGKNTLMRMIIREQMELNPKLEILLTFVKGNMGLVFTNEDLASIRNSIVSNKVPAAAKSGTFAPTDVFVPPGPTGLDPAQTSFFQALNIATKIVRGAIEIVNEVHLIKKGDKVTSSAVALLSKLNIKPFFYGIVVLNVYENGSVYPVHVLDLTPEDLLAKFMGGVQKLAAVSLAVNYTTTASLPHILSSGFKKMAAIALESDYMFKEIDQLKSSSASAPTSAVATSTAKPTNAVVEAPKPEVEEDTMDGVFNLFD